MKRWRLQRYGLTFTVRGPISAKVARLLFACGWEARKA